MTKRIRVKQALADDTIPVYFLDIFPGRGETLKYTSPNPETLIDLIQQYNSRADIQVSVPTAYEIYDAIKPIKSRGWRISSGSMSRKRFMDSVLNAQSSQ